MDFITWIVLVICFIISDLFFYYGGFSDGKEYIRDFYKDDYDDGFGDGFREGVYSEKAKFEELVSAIEEIASTEIAPKKVEKKVSKKSK